MGKFRAANWRIDLAVDDKSITEDFFLLQLVRLTFCFDRTLVFFRENHNSLETPIVKGGQRAGPWTQKAHRRYRPARLSARLLYGLCLDPYDPTAEGPNTALNP